MFGLSFGEVVLLMIVAIVVVGPRNLPQMMRGVGRTVTRIRRLTVDLREQSGIDEILRAEGIEKEVSDLRKLATGNILDVDYYEDEPRRTNDEPALPARSKEYPPGGVDTYGASDDESYARQLTAPEDERVGRGGRSAILAPVDAPHAVDALPADAPAVASAPMITDGANAPPVTPPDGLPPGRSPG